MKYKFVLHAFDLTILSGAPEGEGLANLEYPNVWVANPTKY